MKSRHICRHSLGKGKRQNCFVFVAKSAPTSFFLGVGGSSVTSTNLFFSGMHIPRCADDQTSVELPFIHPNSETRFLIKRHYDRPRWQFGKVFILIILMLLQVNIVVASRVSRPFDGEPPLTISRANSRLHYHHQQHQRFVQTNNEKQITNLLNKTNSVNTDCTNSSDCFSKITINSSQHDILPFPKRGNLNSTPEHIPDAPSTVQYSSPPPPSPSISSKRKHSKHIIYNIGKRWHAQNSGSIQSSKSSTRSDPFQRNFMNMRDSSRLPPPRHIQMFIDYLNPYFQQNALQVQFIVNHWHLFRQQMRRSRKLQKLKELRHEQEHQHLLRKPSPSEEIASHFSKVLIKREALVLRHARNFSEFKTMLTRWKRQKNSTSTVQSEISSSLPEGGTVLRPLIHSALSSRTDEQQSPLGRVSSSNKTRKRRRSVNEEIHKLKISLISESNLSGNDSKLNTDHGREAEDEDDDADESHSDAELRNAYKNYQDFLQNACSPQNKTLCSQALLGMGQHQATLFFPPGVQVKRCNNPVQSTSLVYTYQNFKSYRNMGLCPLPTQGYRDTDLQIYESAGSCTCGTPGEECLPTEVTLKMSSITVFNSTGHLSTELVALTEHVSCGCLRRCDARICVSPLKLIRSTYDDCSCQCSKDDLRCDALLDGRESFSETELPAPLHGLYILPPCYHGHMDEIHLYHRRCPRPNCRILSPMDSF